MLIGNSNFYNGKNSFATNANGTSNAKNQANQTTSKLSVATDIPNSEPRNKGIDRSIEAPDLDKGSNSFKAVLPPNTLNPPNFPKSLYDSLPDFLKRVVKHADTDDERDILLLGSLVTTSGCLTNIHGYLRDEKLYPNLFMFLSAEASSGKGKVSFCKRLVQPVHKALRKKSKQDFLEYEKKLQARQNRKSKKPEEPLKKPSIKMLFIPANSTSTAVYQTLEENNSEGIIFETEGDVLTTAFKSEHGDYSSGFRKAYHHEPISYRRRSNDEYKEIDEPKLSVLLTGTPMQIRALIPNVENGLFSRFIFYRMKLNDQWISAYSKRVKGGLNTYFDNLGEEFFKFHNKLDKFSEIEFEINDEQFKKYDKFFRSAQLKYTVLNGMDFTSIIRRYGVIFFRLAMILSIFRQKEHGELSKNIQCKDIDLNNTMAMVSVLLRHSEMVFSQTPKAPKPPIVKTKQQLLLELVPLEFNRKAFYTCAKKLKISNKSADKLIDKLLESNFIQKRAFNDYVNATKIDSETGLEIKSI